MNDLALLDGLPPELAARVSELRAAGGVAESTRRKYLRGFVCFARWSIWHRLPWLPASEAAVAGFVAELGDAGRARSTVDVFVAAIRFAHKRAGFEDPTASGDVRSVLREVQVQASRRRRTKGARALRYVELAAMLAAVRRTGDGLIQQRNAALLSLGWFGGFRRAELVALNIDDLEHIAWHSLGVHVRQSKGDQLALGDVVGVTRWPVEDVCAVRLVKRWVTGAGLDEGPLFCSVDRWGNMRGRLDEDMVHKLVRQWATEAQLSRIKELGAHSLRVGPVNDFEDAGIPMMRTSRHLRHSSLAITERYVRTSRAVRDSPIGLLAAALFPGN